MRLVGRAGWGAAAPRGGGAALSASSSLTVHWVGSSSPLSDPHSRCAGRVQGIQRHHQIGNGWADVAYNFLVCQHGVVFEGRGWGRRSAANGTNVGNGSSHAVCALIGQGEVPSAALLRGLADVRAEHARRFGTDKIVPHSYWKATSCPGPDLHRWWVQDPDGGDGLEGLVAELSDRQRANLMALADLNRTPLANLLAVAETFNGRRVDRFVELAGSDRRVGTLVAMADTVRDMGSNGASFVYQLLRRHREGR